MSNVAVLDRPKSVTLDMADRYGMDAAPFEATLRATVFPSNGTREEFAAFLLVARNYNLNPVTKEIYAFPKKGGGIIPIVSVDGWMNLVNSHPAFDGMDFCDVHDEDGKLVSTTCTIYRKDRNHPISVTEYLSECIRSTDPWKMQHRMLRHKSAIQCARYAFGFAGIYDEDEAERFADRSSRLAPSASLPTTPIVEQAMVASEQVAQIEHQPAAEVPQAELKQATPSVRRAPSPADISLRVHFDAEGVKKRFAKALAAAKSEADINSAWEEIVAPVENEFLPPELDDLQRILRWRLAEIDEAP